ncbi:hypothetical protein PS624_03930 [Pseudomonas fluorescens]|uniref:Transmembrane protein n=1 Tax=Pseudomonas fluorescens TaxID=294 RepID=A0A5E6V596_PSEFL|nr:hypothetical protein PS624_03930 [Pseudomonas fluorescens]
MSRPVLRAWAPTVAVTVRTPRPAIVVRSVVGLPMLIVVAVLRALIAVVTLTRLLGLAHGVGPWLDRQAVGRQLRRRWRLAHRIGIVGRAILIAVLPLAIVVAVVLELAAVVATNDLVVLRARLILLRLILRWIVLRTRLIVAATALIVALMIRTVAAAIRAAILWLIGKRLHTDTQTQQTNTSQTPDARIHAFSHCGACKCKRTCH